MTHNKYNLATFKWDEIWTNYPDAGSKSRKIWSNSNLITDCFKKQTGEKIKQTLVALKPGKL